MQNRPYRLGPLAVPIAVTDILNPPVTSGGVNVGTPLDCFVILKHVRWVNTTAAPITFIAYLGATGGSAAGTEVFGSAKSVAANDVYDWYGYMLIRVVDFLTMIASGAGLVVQGEGEIGVGEI